MRWLIFKLVLAPMIRRDYRLREASTRPDRWYWADRIAVGWGMFV